jgi:imidazolonepropionase-like amidohydrolase
MKNGVSFKKRHRINAYVTGLALAGICLLASAGRPPRSAQPGTEAIKDARIFDGEKVIPSGTVVIKDGKIAAVGAKIAVPADAEVIDGRGKTLLPGLIDSHVHTWAPEQLKQAAMFGVTTVIDMFTYIETAKAIRKALAGGARDLAFFISPQVLLTVPGGHGTQFGAPIPTIEPATDIQKFVDDRIAEGSDFIKIIQDDGSSYNFPRPTLTKDQVAAIIRAAHARGKLAVIHAATLRNCEDGLESGVDGLVHLYFNDAYDPDFGKLAARAKAFVIPTLSVLHSMAGMSNAALIADPGLAPFVSPQTAGEVNRTMEGFHTSPAAYAAAERALKQLKEAAVPILAGTDAPNPGTTFGASLHGELELLVKAGLTPIEALRAATSVPADKFHLEGRGRVRRGAFADLLLVDGDPGADILATRRVAAVWREGVRLDREAFRKTVKEAMNADDILKQEPPPEYSPAGGISDFEGGKIAADFGAGWVDSTDSMMGGKSQVKMEWTGEGARGSQGAMKLSGEIAEGAMFRWAGAMFGPGKTIMAPANLSSRKGISFWAKGDARQCALEFFAQSRGFMPVIKFFKVGPEWKEYTVTFEEVKLDGTGIMGVFIGAVTVPGTFVLYVDDVKLK